jgi:hypothetical protein
VLRSREALEAQITDLLRINQCELGITCPEGLSNTACFGELLRQAHEKFGQRVAVLVSRGVVQRTADPLDNRRVLVVISDFGLDTVARLNERVDAHHESIEGALGARRTTQLKRLLERFIEESRARD